VPGNLNEGEIAAFCINRAGERKRGLHFRAAHRVRSLLIDFAPIELPKEEIHSFFEVKPADPCIRPILSGGQEKG
jgi:hypothetical protein